MTIALTKSKEKSRSVVVRVQILIVLEILKNIC